MTETETGLPPGWAIGVSRNHNREYFLNQGTKESSWEPPFGSDEGKLKEYLTKFKAQGNKPVIPQDGKIRATHFLIKHNLSRKRRSWKSPEGITRSRDEAIQMMKNYEKQILSGEVGLADIISTESDCSSHSQGGDLGYFGKGQMQPSFEEAAFNLNVGELSPIVESDSGIHLIQRTA